MNPRHSPARHQAASGTTSSSSGRYWILTRYRSAALLCALLPCLLVGLLLGREYSTQRGKLATEPVRMEVSRDSRLTVEAQAAAIRARLKRLSFSSSALRDYAQLVLAAPQTFGSSQGYTAPIIGAPKNVPADSGNTSPAKPASPAAKPAPDAPAFPPAAAAESTAKAPLDNPIMYSQGKGGAIRKLFDDGGSAVFYRARQNGVPFAAAERQKLYATAALDPLLKSAVKNEPLCVQAWFLSKDGLLRSYPFRDFGAFEGSRDLTKLSIYAWSKDKADSSGLVWTSPYPSPMSGGWAVACLASVSIGGKQVGVVGTEVGLSKLDKEALAFSLGEGAISWLQRTDGTVLAAPAGGEESLGVKALGIAELPAEDLPAKKLLADANVLTGGEPQISNALAGVDKAATSERPLGQPGEGRTLYTTPVGVADWTLGAVMHSPLVASLHEYERKLQLATQRRVGLLIAILLISVGAALLVAWLESRRIIQPLRMLTMQLRQAGSGPVSVSIADEGELGQLAAALQGVVDRQHVMPEPAPQQPQDGLFASPLDDQNSAG